MSSGGFRWGIILFSGKEQRIQDFREEGANPRKGPQPISWPKFAENCIKMKKIGPRPGALQTFYYVDPPLKSNLPAVANGTKRDKGGSTSPNENRESALARTEP